jgi:hypothetical protein
MISERILDVGPRHTVDTDTEERERKANTATVRGWTGEEQWSCKHLSIHYKYHFSRSGHVSRESDGRSILHPQTLSDCPTVHLFSSSSSSSSSSSPSSLPSTPCSMLDEVISNNAEWQEASRDRERVAHQAFPLCIRSRL